MQAELVWARRIRAQCSRSDSDQGLQIPRRAQRATLQPCETVSDLRAADVLVQALLRQAIQIDKHRRPMNIKMGDLVWLSTKNLNLAYPNKFTPKYLGPFTVSHVISSGNACKLDLPPSIRVKENTFNVSQLREHVLRSNALGPSAPPQPPPAFVDDTGVASFHIEKIVGHELRKSGVQFLVRWQNYSAAHDSWESESELLLQHGGRVAMALYRERRAEIDRHPNYAARLSKFGRQDPLPALSAGDAAPVAAFATTNL